MRTADCQAPSPAPLSAGSASPTPIDVVMSSPQPTSDAATARPPRQIHVVVVAVPKFSIPGYNGDVLRQSFLDRCDFIKRYFEKHLGKENVKVDQYCTQQLTTRESLRRLFTIDIPRFSANTVTLLFIMSHGEEVDFQNGYMASDVELITSDTRITDDGDDADGERRFTSILIGSEMLTWLESAPRGSTILTFLDFCHSGAAASLSTSLAQSIQQQFGLRSLVVSSSLPSDDTYKALFTQALLDLWDTSGGCMNLDTMPTAVWEKMKLGAPLKGTEGLPVVLVQYKGPLCLGNFGGDHKLLFLYGGQDAEMNPYNYQIAMAGGDHKVITSSLLASTYLPIPLDSGQYAVSVTRDDKTIGSWNIDLTSGQTEVIWLDSAAKPADFGKFAEQVATTADAAGLNPDEVGRLNARAAAVYHVAGLPADAARVEQRMVLSGIPMSRLVTLESSQLAANPTLQALNLSANTNDSDHSIKVANGLKLLGDFRSAATLLQGAAAQESDPTKKADVATQAYIAFVALGDVKSAASVKRQFSLDPQQVKPLGPKLNLNTNTFQGARTTALAGAFGAHISAVH